MSTEIVVLRDSGSGSQAKILASFGFNCYQFTALVDHEPVDVIWSEPGFELGDKRASGSGIPLLFPFAGRLRGKSFVWHGREYPAEGDDGRGNAIHGYVLGRPWRVTEQTDQEVTAEFHASIDEPKLLEAWPADFCITATYSLRGTRLESDFLIENPDSHPLPFGFGIHPYFRVPLGGADSGPCRVRLPFQERWDMTDMLPTGQRVPVEDPAAFRAGLPFAEMQFDDVFTGLEFQDGECVCRIIDPDSARQLTLRFNDLFHECVVYNPPHREAVCVEPYTCVPNAAELQSNGVATNLRVLQPGESARARVVMEVSTAQQMRAE
jgi:aldose 1-epimerase